MNPVGTAGCLLIAALFSLPTNAFATVASIETLQKAVQQARPGTIIDLADGTYETKRPIGVQEIRGTPESPIVVRAEHRGKALIGGSAEFVVRDFEHVVIEGFCLHP